MSAELRPIVPLILQFPLGFADSGPDAGPNQCGFVLSSFGSNPLLPLRPLRLQPCQLGGQPATEPAEWYVAYDDQVFAQILLGFSSGERLLSPPFPVDGVLRLTLGVWNPGEFCTEPLAPAFALTGGSVAVKLENLDQTDFFNQVAQLWPTHDFRDVDHLYAEPGGVFAGGRLPGTFFAGIATGTTAPDAPRATVLRLPRGSGDWATPEGVPGAGQRPCWTLTSFPFSPSISTAPAHVQAWAGAVRGFTLGLTGGTKVGSFVDSLVCKPDETCTVGVLGLDGSGIDEGLSWFARSICTRINLGGGLAAEASYTPETIQGRARIQGGDWTVGFASSARPSAPASSPAPAPSARAPSPPSVRITLTNSPSKADVEVDGALQPLIAPSVPIDPPAADGKTGQGFRLWLCTDSGWAALETPVAQAVLDPKKDTEGTILGVLEIDRIASQLANSVGLHDATAGLSIDVKVRATSSVVVALAGSLPADLCTPGSVSSLELRVTDPFLIVTTPPFFYQPPEVTVLPGQAPPPLPSLPALTAGTAATDPGSGSGSGPTPAPAAPDSPETTASSLEQELAKNRFRPAVFISQNMTPDLPAPASGATSPPPPPAPLTVTLSKSNDGFALEIPHAAVTVWQRPATLPVARTYPLDPDQDLNHFLDANRGLVPFKPRDASSDVTLKFGSDGLPSLPDLLIVKDATGLAVVDGSWRLASAAGRGGSTAYFLPTLPGLELDLSPAMADPAKPPTWVYRHGVPVLDEAFATASEARRDPTTAAQSEPGPPAAGDLPPGFDPTRVVGTEAFTFGPAFAAEARGWLSCTDANPSGALALSAGSATLAGRAPTLAITLTDPVTGGSTAASFQRDASTEGLSAPVRVVPPAATMADLSSFQVGLRPTASATGTQYDDDLVHGGLPLMAAVLGGRIVTHDALGYRREEPDPAAPGVVRVRRPGAANPTRRLSLRAALPPGVMQLELSGVDLAEPGAAASDSPRQAWLLHDGASRPARLAGFPLRPITLDQFTLVAGNLVVTITAAVDLVDPKQSDPKKGLRDPVAPPGQETVSLTWSRPATGTNPAWTLTGVSGNLDWRFRVPDAESLTSVTRLVAAFSGLPTGDSWSLLVTQLELATPAGLLVLENLKTSATLAGGKLTLLGPVDATQKTLTVHLDAFTLDRAALADGPLPDWPIALPHHLTWVKTGGNFAWAIHQTLGQHGIDDGWSLELSRGSDVLVHAPLDAIRAAPGRLLFRSTPPGTSPPPLPAMPAGSWFDRAGSDLAAVGAVFREADTLDILSAHVLIRLVPRSSVTGLDGELAARLTVEAVGADADPSLAASGWLAMTNRIGLRTPSGDATHTATLLFRDAPWTLDALFLGIGPDDSGSDTALAVEHALTVAGHTARWQVVQPVRPCTAQAFARNYLPSPPPDALKNQLTFDLGWVWWLRVPDPPEPSGKGSGLALDSPHLKSVWTFRARPADRGQFDRELAFVTRLPFAFAVPGAIVAQPITLAAEPGGNRSMPTSGAAGGTTIAPLQRGLDGSGSTSLDAPVYVRGGPDSSWIDPAALAAYFGQADFARPVGQPPQWIPPLLPAYEDDQGEATTLFPSSIGDWAWLLAALTAMGSPPELRLAGAALRTPYVPLTTAVPLPVSALVEMPLTFQKDPSAQYQADPLRVDAQLLAFVGGELRTVRRAGLEPDDPQATDADRAELAVDWAGEALDASRRDEAALVLRDLGSLDEVPRPFAAVRAERPAWPTAPLAPDPGAGGYPPVYDPDPRSRPPAPTDAPERLVPAAAAGLDSDAPVYHVFAARPEVPPPTLVTRSIAATRIRLALTGLANQPGTKPGALAPARRASVTATVITAPQTVLGDGDLMGWTKAEDVPFQVVDPTGKDATKWLTFPTPGAAPHARRDPLPRGWASGETGEVVTIAPPLIDAVVWARRPGEMTHSLVAGYRGGYPSATATDRVFADATDPGQEISLRRPRAMAGPFESVTIEPIFAKAILDRRFQYTRLRLTQMLDAFPPPDHGEIAMVLTSRSDVYPSAADTNIAEASPALLRYTGSGTSVQVAPFSLFLMARSDLVTQGDFPITKFHSFRTLIMLQDTSDLPPGEENHVTESTPPVKSDPETGPPGACNRLVLFDLDFPVPTDTAWRRLFDDVIVLDVGAYLSDANHKKTDISASLQATLANTGMGTSIKPLYLLAATYNREKDASDAKWLKPDAPRAVIAIARVNEDNELVKPRSALALLAASTANNPTPADGDYRLAGFGRLDDDAFSAVHPVIGPTEDKTTLVGWARVADLQSLDRLDAASAAAAATALTNRNAGNDPAATSIFRYDVVFYGPGGELVPTRSPASTFTDGGPTVNEQFAGRTVSMRAAVNGKYVTADKAGHDPLIANREAAQEWEWFDVVAAGGGHVALRARANGKYVTAGAGLSPLIASQDAAVGPGVLFDVEPLTDGRYALRAVDSGKYVSADDEGKSPLIANREIAQLWESFSLAIVGADDTRSEVAAGIWKVTAPENGAPWTIAFGSGIDIPQVAALHPRSGYFRLVSGTTWGTSIILPPCFWSGGILSQGPPIKATSHVDGNRLVIDASGVQKDLNFKLQISLSPPGDGRIEAEVSGSTEGQISLDTRPGEAFKPVMLSSMRIAPTKWDASSVIIDNTPIPFNDAIQGNHFFIAPAPLVQAKRFGFRGGKSEWQPGQPAPTVEILLDDALQIAGYRTSSTNPNGDNLGLWAATDKVLASWHYIIVASRPM